MYPTLKKEEEMRIRKQRKILARKENGEKKIQVQEMKTYEGRQFRFTSSACKSTNTR
jgi:hypothetical protein